MDAQEIVERWDLPDAFRFDTSDVCSKWGFGDGDVLGDVMAAFEESRFRPAPGDDSFAQWSRFVYHHHHVLLWWVWADLIAPELDEDIDVFFSATLHNPTRAMRGDELLESDDFTAQPRFVEVDTADILAVAEKRFPDRGRGWQTLHKKLYNSILLAEYFEAVAAADEAATGREDWQLELAAELMGGGDTLEEALAKADLVARDDTPAG